MSILFFFVCVYGFLRLGYTSIHSQTAIRVRSGPDVMSLDQVAGKLLNSVFLAVSASFVAGQTSNIPGKSHRADTENKSWIELSSVPLNKSVCVCACVFAHARVCVRTFF